MTKLMLAATCLFLTSLSSAAEKPRIIPLQDERGQWGYIEPIYGTPYEKTPRTIPHQYDWALNFSGQEKGDYAVVEIKGKFGLIDRKGKLVVPAEYDWVNEMENGLAIVYRDGKAGAVDLKGRLVVPLEYDQLHSATPAGLLSAARGQFWGVINRANKVILPLEFVLANAQDDGVIRAYKKDGGWRLYDETGARLFENSGFDFAIRNGALFDVSIKNVSQLVDSSGASVLPDSVRTSKGPAPHLLIGRQNDQYGLFDTTARKWVMEPQFKELSVHGDGLLIASTGRNRYQFFDSKGTPLFGERFDNVRYLDQYFKVKRGNRWALMTAKGKYLVGFDVIDDDNIRLNDFGISARKESGWGLIDENGKQLFAFEYAAPSDPRTNPFEVSGDARVLPIRHIKTGKLGVLSPKLEWLVPLGTVEYDDLSSSGFADREQDLLVTARDGKNGLYSISQKKELLPPKYGSLTMEGAYARFRHNEHLAIYRYSDNKIYAASGMNFHRYNEDTGLFLVEQDQLYGLRSRDGKLVVPLQFSGLESSSSEPATRKLYVGSRSGKMGIIDANGKAVIPFSYDADGDVSSLSSQGLQLTLNGENRWVDLGNRTVVTAKQMGIPPNGRIQPRQIGNMQVMVGMPRDDSAKKSLMFNDRTYPSTGGDIMDISGSELAFKDGLMAVRRDGKFGYINQYGVEVITPQFERASQFNGGVAYAKKDGKYFLINRRGEPLKHVNVALVLLMQKK